MILYLIHNQANGLLVINNKVKLFKISQFQKGISLVKNVTKYIFVHCNKWESNLFNLDNNIARHFFME